MPTEYQTSKIKCPKCGRVSSAPVFDTLDLTEASDFTRKMALSGKLFRFECPYCGKKRDLNYPITATDDNMGAIITVLNKNDKRGDYKRILDVYRSLEQEEDEKYRIVDTCQELSEKMRIFNDGLDDRVIEILKMLISEDIVEKKSELPNVRCVYKRLTNGTMTFTAVYNKDKYEIELPTSSYLPIEEALYELEDKTLLRAYMINWQWADKVVGAMMEE